MTYTDGIVKNTEFFTTAELAKKLKMNVQVITRKVQAGEIKAYKIGKEWRIPEMSVYAWLESNVNAGKRASHGNGNGNGNGHGNGNSKPDSNAEPMEAYAKITPVNRLPMQPSRRKYLLEYILAQFEPDRTYSEDEVNRIVERYHTDTETVRREFLSERMMVLDDKNYRRRSGYRLAD